jgi:hypothetical protein
MKKPILVLLTALLGAFACTSAEKPAAGTPTAVELRVMTFNIEWGRD